MKKFVKAKLNDKLQYVYFLFGFKINDNFPLNDKTKNYIFQFENHKYFGSHLDYLGDMGNLLHYTYNKETFVQNINIQLQMLGIKKITLDEKIYLMWGKLINDQKNVDKKMH